MKPVEAPATATETTGQATAATGDGQPAAGQKQAPAASEEDAEEEIEQRASDDPNDQLEFLTSVEGLDQGRAALVLLSCYPDRGELVPFAAISRILTRLGVIKKSSHRDALRENVATVLESEHFVRLTYLLARHGGPAAPAETCHSAAEGRRTHGSCSFCIGCNKRTN